MKIRDGQLAKGFSAGGGLAFWREACWWLLLQVLLSSTLDLMKVFIILRLCPVGKSGKRALTEKCFQRLPLRFFTNKTWIRTLHRSGKVSRCLELGHNKFKNFSH